MKTKSELLCNRAIEYVLTRKDEDFGDLTVSAVARALEVSQSYLARTFRRERDCSIKEYLLREKMLRSALLLINKPQLTVRRLAEIMGFQDINYFNRVFKSNFGISPGRYRECKKI